MKWVDLRNSGVQLRLLESKGRVSGSGHYGHYGAKAIVKSAYNQNTESHILLELSACCVLLDRVSVSYNIGAPVDVVESEKWSKLLMLKIQITGQV